MFKLIIISVAGYLVYRIAKNKIKTMLFGQIQPREIKSTESLIKCQFCEKYIDEKSAISKNKATFCSIVCMESYTKKRG
jgi:hypothetical protein